VVFVGGVALRERNSVAVCGVEQKMREKLKTDEGFTKERWVRPFGAHDLLAFTQRCPGESRHPVRATDSQK